MAFLTITGYWDEPHSDPIGNLNSIELFIEHNIIHRYCAEAEVGEREGGR